MKKILVPILFLLVIISFAFKSENESIASIVTQKLLNYLGHSPYSKTYIHTDRAIYAAGDTVWFSAYMVDGFMHRADSVNTVLYVELTNPEKKIVHDRFITKLVAGRGEGQLQIPLELPSGSYSIRAYTNWMRNFDSDFFYTGKIDVVSSLNETFVSIVKDTSVVDLQFFPEGGELVANLESKVAFKAIGFDGLGKEIQGCVISGATRDTVAKFSSSFKGMGYFSFQPKAGVSYTVKAGRIGVNEWTQFEFVPVKETGYTLTVDNLSNKNFVRVFGRSSTGNWGDGITIVAHTRGMVSGGFDVKPKNERFVVQLPKSELPDGISTITMFDSKGNPVAERLLFIDNKRRLNIALKVPKENYRTKEQVNLAVQISDTSGLPIQTITSLAAIEAGTIPAYASTIESYLLLQSDLKGYIEEPDYYFSSRDPSARINLDLLMLTQGWRKYNWQDILDEKQPNHQWYPETGITLSGSVLRLNAKEAGTVNLTVWMQAKDSSNVVLASETDAQGKFKVVGIDVEDTLQVLVQARKLKGGNGLDIRLDSLMVPGFSIQGRNWGSADMSSEYYKKFLNDAREFQYWLQNLKNSSAKLLNEVTVKTKKEPERRSNQIYGMPDATLKVTNLLRSSARSVLDLLRGRIAGVNVIGAGPDATVQIRGQGTPLFLLDGMSTEREVALNIPVEDIESIDVLKGASAAVFGGRGGGGVISIITRTGLDDEDNRRGPSPGSSFKKLAGYSVPKVFYSPKYEVENPSETLDMRRTLHWVPLLKTDSLGKAEVSFFNSTIKGKMLVVVEGITSEGLVGRQTLTYDVK